MGADITFKQTINGITNDLEFNRIKDRPGEVCMHRRDVNHHGILEDPIGGKQNDSHYHDDINIPNQVTDKKGNVYMVTALDPQVMLKGTKMHSVSIPGTVKTIPFQAFAGCLNLSIVGLDEGTGEIDDYAFQYCNVLRFYIPDSVRRIGSRAFDNCSNLEYLEIGSGMLEMKDAFKRCLKINTVKCMAENPPYIVENTFETETLLHATLYVPYTAVEKYKNHPLWGKFRSIFEDPDSVPEDVQHERTYYREIDGVRYFLNMSCKEAQVVGLKDGSSYQQKEVVIRDSFKLNENVTLEVSQIDKDAFLNSAVTSIKLPGTLTVIDDNAFKGASLTRISLPDSLVKIGNAAFKGCPLTEIDIPGKVTSIGDNAFEACTKLERITLHDGLKKIGACAFAENPALHELMLPETVEDIGLNAFYRTALKSITCMNYTPPRFEGDQAFDPEVLQNAVLMVPSNVISIYKARKTTWGKFNKIIAIGGSSGDSSNGGSDSGDGTGKKPIPTGTGEKVGKGGCFIIEGICYKVVRDDFRIVHITLLPDQQLYKGNLVIPSQIKYNGLKYDVEGIEDINNGTQRKNNDLTSVTIPKSVSFIGDGAFENVIGLKHIDIPNTVYKMGKDVFCLCSNLESVTIGRGLESIPLQCFYGTALKQVTIPDTIKYIENWAFTATPLTEIELPDTLGRIGGCVFHKCQYLAKVTLGKHIANIGLGTFKGCTALKTIICRSQNPPVLECGNVEVGETVFDLDTLNNATLMVPTDAISAYQADKEWGQFKNIVGFVVEEKPVQPSTPSKNSSRENFEVDGIRYWVKDASTVYVTQKPDTGYTGDVVIPATVQKEGVTYQVKKVSNYAFKDSSGLTAVTLPTSIEEVKKESFEGCPALNRITCLATTPPAVMEKAIPAELAQRVTLVVPQGSIGQYATAEGWKLFKKFEVQ